MKIIILLINLILTFKLRETIKSSDYCLNNKEKKQQKCHGELSVKCDHNYCAKDQFSCLRVTNLSSVKNLSNLRRYKSFKNLIKNCTRKFEFTLPLNNKPIRYKWNLSEICLNTKECVSVPMRIWSINQIKQNEECECSGNYSFRCNSDYCAKNEKACNGLKRDLVSKTKIIKCNNPIKKVNKLKYLFIG
jgi:hypothetical protein